eukprot:1159633-Pelagomonas_calceolata.AAC.9
MLNPQDVGGLKSVPPLLVNKVLGLPPMLHAALLSHHPFASPPHTQHSLPHSSAPNYCSGRGSSTTPSVLNRTDGHAQVLCSHLMLASITAYNALADLLPLLPCAAAAGTPDAAQHEATLRSLPSMLSSTRPSSLCKRATLPMKEALVVVLRTG